MKALTIWQPWATLIAIGAKPYEFRGWKPPTSLLGKQLAIHAGARPVRVTEVRDLLERLDDRERTPCLWPELARPLLEKVLCGLRGKGAPLLGDVGLHLPLSCIVAVCWVGPPKPGDQCAAEFGAGATNDSDRDGTFNWGWPLENVLPMGNIPARGAQGLWDWTPW